MNQNEPECFFLTKKHFMCGCRNKKSIPQEFDEPNTVPPLMSSQSTQMTTVPTCACCAQCSTKSCTNERQSYATASEILIGVGAVFSLSSYSIQLHRSLSSKSSSKPTPLSRRFVIIFLVGEIFYIIGAIAQLYGTGTGWVLLISNFLFAIVMVVTLIVVTRNRHDPKNT